MIKYSNSARRQVDELTAYFLDRDRPEAVDNLLAALDRVEATLLDGSARPRSYPATYRQLARVGRGWLRQGGYWVAFDMIEPPVVAAVFWAAADIPGRYRALD